VCVQAYYTVNDKPVGGATITFQLRDPKTNTPVGKTYTAKTDPSGVARVTVDPSPVAIVRLVGASTPSNSGTGTVTAVLDPLSSPSITWVSQQLVIFPTPNARVPSGNTITVVAQYSGGPVRDLNAVMTHDHVYLAVLAPGVPSHSKDKRAVADLHARCSSHLIRCEAYSCCEANYAAITSCHHLQRTATLLQTGQLP
jgi:hypothetical protein